MTFGKTSITRKLTYHDGSSSGVPSRAVSCQSRFQRVPLLRYFFRLTTARLFLRLMTASGGAVGFGVETLRGMPVADARRLSIWFFAGGFIGFGGFAEARCQSFQLYRRYGLER